MRLCPFNIGLLTSVDCRSAITEPFTSSSFIHCSANLCVSRSLEAFASAFICSSNNAILLIASCTAFSDSSRAAFSFAAAIKSTNKCHLYREDVSTVCRYYKKRQLRKKTKHSPNFVLLLFLLCTYLAGAQALALQ